MELTTVKFEAIHFVSKQYDFFPVACQSSVMPKCQIQYLSVVSKTNLSVVSEKYE